MRTLKPINLVREHEGVFYNVEGNSNKPLKKLISNYDLRKEVRNPIGYFSFTRPLVILDVIAEDVLAKYVKSGQIKLISYREISRFMVNGKEDNTNFNDTEGQMKVYAFESLDRLRLEKILRESSINDLYWQNI